MSDRQRTIEVLLSTARELLVEATKLVDDPDRSYHISTVTKAERPPFVIPDESEWEIERFTPRKGRE